MDKDIDNSIIEFKDVEGRNHLDDAKELFVEYSRSIGVSLCFQGFDEELDSLPGKYSPPKGSLILAYVDGSAAACAALRYISDEICELKRVYVREEIRGLGLGREIVVRMIEEAKALGYGYMRLDTLPSMTSARKLYFSLGFHEIEPYIFNPHEGTLYMELKL
ncbi:GNAT family N-acetyltransferase [Youngiibacter multivorans]|uniref:Ribosomal protein S18 acetylase RimI-like enzyme n=1 Tax=Youngiibacter multivorans TaxID=937251 RepID=A0ABS4G126_9CLOT|nr:GNAT family N-acetyltransferase [Youngiibacter multivorans]MBP1918035.1 ribosomal protein S18 acetylase RimI-like enzyme [Youngiibacter multivorans]